VLERERQEYKSEEERETLVEGCRGEGGKQSKE
jgi:hypothetical protein